MWGSLGKKVVKKFCFVIETPEGVSIMVVIHITFSHFGASP
jgi:hypothetical protein